MRRRGGCVKLNLQKADMAMRVMVFVKATAESEQGVMPTPELLAAMGRFNDELAAAGIMVAGAGLKPTAEARRIAFDGLDRTVITGPFAPTCELVAGFWIWEVADMGEAVAWAKRCPNPMPGPSELEIRPYLEAANFADLLPPERLTAPRNGERGTLGVA